MDFDDFYILACENFGKEKFSVGTFDYGDLDALNIKYGCNLKKEDFDSYKAVWILNNNCPCCGESLSFSFTWGIVHGSGYCSGCKKVDIKYYHYIGDCKMPFTGWSLIGF